MGAGRALVAGNGYMQPAVCNNADEVRVALLTLQLQLERLHDRMAALARVQQRPSFIEAI
jgi:hypothetical protein